MKEVLMYIVGSLVEKPEAVKVGVAEDGDVVRRFLTHSCDCPRPAGERYQTRHMHKPVFKGR